MIPYHGHHLEKMEFKRIYKVRDMMRKIMLILLLLLLAVPACAEIHVDEVPPGDWTSRNLLRLTVFPPFQNDAFLMECGGKSMLIDGGTAQFYQKMHAALEKRGYGEYINCIVNTHPHDDHIECAMDMVRRGLKIDTFISPFAEDYGNKLHKKMVQMLQEKGYAYQQVLDGDSFEFGGAKIDCFSWLEAVDVNARSLQMHIHFGETSILITGDLTGLGQRHYLERLDPKDLQSVILKAPHHSLVHMVPEYLDAVSPEFVILTNEQKRAPKSENQLEKRGIPHMYNGDGTITLETDGVDWYITQEPGWN